MTETLTLNYQGMTREMLDGLYQTAKHRLQSPKWRARMTEREVARGYMVIDAITAEVARRNRIWHESGAHDAYAFMVELRRRMWCMDTGRPVVTRPANWPGKK